MPEPEPPPPGDPTKDGAFSGGGGTAFDPSAGIIDVGGDVAAKGSKGLVAFAAAGALVVGMLFGWVGQSQMSKSERIERAKKKGQKMAAEVAAVSKMRKDISLSIGDIKKQIMKDPAAGGAALKELNATNFEAHPKVDALFGWQLASIHPKDIKKVFTLYEEANGLKTDLAYLAGFVEANAANLSAKGGPASFGVWFNDEGGITLVNTLAPMCAGADQQPKPCTPAEAENAVGYLVKIKLGDEKPVYAPKGLEKGQVMALNSADEMHIYLVGQKPENNAKLVHQGMWGRVGARLEAMNKVERRAINALKAYASDPNVDSDADEAGDE
jgi:hypothetical protein